MSEDKAPAEEKDGANAPDNPSIEEAMAEAVKSMEAREGEEDEGIDVEVGEESASKDAGAAVTEALIEAKRELEVALTQTQKEAEGFRDKWMRAAADMENYKKRAQRERADVQKFANEKLLKDFLPILDDLDRALEMVGSSEVPEGASQIVDGVKLLHKKFLSQLERHGVTTFEAKGQAFDPSFHEAVQQVHSDDVPAGSVADELQRGFMISGRLLRPALVTVSLGPEVKPPDEKEDAEEP